MSAAAMPTYIWHPALHSPSGSTPLSRPLRAGRRAAQEKQRQQEKAVAAEEEARMTLEIADEVRRQVEAAMASPGVAARIQQRLKVRHRLHTHSCFLTGLGKAAVQRAERSESAQRACCWVIAGFPLVCQEERAALEEKVTQQLAAERRALLARKRAQQDERRRKADDLERILHENQRKVPPQHCVCMGC